jgi:hypothetical protein
VSVWQVVHGLLDHVMTMLGVPFDLTPQTLNPKL